MKKSHKEFLEKEYFSIIDYLSSQKNHGIIYVASINIFQNQLAVDLSKIDNILKPFYEIIEIRNKSKEQDLIKNLEKGTKYAMKETENLREIKVTVQINKDLRSEIEQDF